MHLLAVAASVLVVQTATVSPGERVAVALTGRAAAKPVRVYLAGSAGTVRRVGTIPRGARMLRFRLPRLAADAYAPALRSGSRIVLGRGRLSVRALAPAGFGPVGAPGCAPASPLSGVDAFGTAAGAELWALLAFTPRGASLVGSTATYDGVVGQEMKIVFRMTSGVPSVFYSVSPDGTVVPPVWGPEPHLGSSWLRPGREWGAGFVFDTPGCWRIHAGAPPAQGDVWLVVRS